MTPGASAPTVACIGARLNARLTVREAAERAGLRTHGTAGAVRERARAAGARPACRPCNGL
jgi:hypothetical protein